MTKNEFRLAVVAQVMGWIWSSIEFLAGEPFDALVLIFVVIMLQIVTLTSEVKK